MTVELQAVDHFHEEPISGRLIIDDVQSMQTNAVSDKVMLTLERWCSANWPFR